MLTHSNSWVQQYSKCLNFLYSKANLVGVEEAEGVGQEY